MKSHEINYHYWPTIFQSIFDWTFNMTVGTWLIKLPMLQCSFALLLGTLQLYMTRCTD